MEGEGSRAFKKLRVLLDRMMLRRTKYVVLSFSFGIFLVNIGSLYAQLERADDLGLPPRTVVVRRDYFSAEEKELYASLYSDSKRNLLHLFRFGNNSQQLFSTSSSDALAWTLR